MQVFKFGGASVKDATAIQHVAQILKQYQGEKLFIVISAMGKVTNQLEAIYKSYIEEKDDLPTLFKAFQDQHIKVVEELMEEPKEAKKALQVFFDPIENLFEKKPVPNRPFLYDQIVSIGEMLSTTIVSHYLNAQGIQNQWLNVKSCIKTDNTYREGIVDWEKTEASINEVANASKSPMMITQGFLGATSENFTTTLGREGSDYSAAIFANCLNATKLSIWKDVPGILNGDPRFIEDAVKINQLTYREANEMTYYGAKVIHVKTMRPLREKNIPLEVRSFIEPEKTGTLIRHFKEKNEVLPPIIVIKQTQLFLHISRKDKQLLSEKDLKIIYDLFDKNLVISNLSAKTAYQWQVAIDLQVFKMEQLLKDLRKAMYLIELPKGSYQLLTFKNYTLDFVAKHTENTQLFLKQQTGDVLHLLVQGLKLAENN